MEKSITISIEKYNVLRGTLEKANELFKSLGEGLGNEKIPKVAPKQTKAQGIDKYKKLLSSGERVRKPDYLKK